MKNGIAHKARVAPIKLGKLSPFLVCFIVLISYAESLYALATKNYLQFEDGVYLNKPVSWFIASCFEYDLPTLLFLCIVSVSIETCLWNKLACLYLGVNLYEKTFFLTHEFSEQVYLYVAIINIALCMFFVYKGIKQALK